MLLKRRLASFGLALLLLPGLAWSAARPFAVTVFAAASLTDALQALASPYQQTTGHTVELSFGASSTLARQIEGGAGADVFFSADQEWMDYLAQRELIQPATRQNLLGNRLVLVAPADSAVQLKIGPKFPLLAALQGGRLVTGDPDSVPVGRYARAALTSLGVWDEVAQHLVRADNVRSALAFVARGEVPLGIVYETDALIDPHVRIVDTFPAESHQPITYPIALTRTASAEATAFIAFLRGPAAAATFRKFGIAVLP